MIIERPKEVERVKAFGKWVLVYGRRKTGKSFLIENFVKYDDFFFVKRDRSILSIKDSKTIAYETLLELLKRELAEGKTVVVDEFHRLGGDFFDFLHASKKQGKLILVSSTLFLSRKLFSSRSALLGFFAEAPIGLISIEDAARTLKSRHMKKKELLEAAILAREPLAIDFFDSELKPREIFAKVLLSSVRTVPALVGEIFVEEERSISAVYEAILRAVANGHVVSGGISSYLFSRKLIKKDDPSVIQQYLNNLADFGIIKKIRVHGKARFVYKHVSPLARLFYYCDEKYNISERTPTEAEVSRVVDELMPKLVEDNVRELIAGRKGLTESIAEAKDYDVDACLLKYKRPQVVVEVKWKNKITKEDVEKAEKTLSKINAPEKLLFVPDKKQMRVPTSLKIVDILDFI